MTQLWTADDGLVDVTAAFKGIAQSFAEIVDDIHRRGWTVSKVHIKDGTYVAEGKNPHGEKLEAKGRTDATAAANLLVRIMRREHMRASSVREKLGAWDHQGIEQQFSQIAQAYAKAPVYEPKAAPSFMDLAQDCGRRAQTIRQQLRVEYTDDPVPYESADDLREDVTKKRHILITRAYAHHPVWSEQQMLDYRLVVDVLGHTIGGADWGWHGTCLAFASLAPLLAEQPQKALFTELLGQAAFGQFYRQWGPQKICFLEDEIEKLQEQENKPGHSGVHPSQSIVPAALPSIFGKIGMAERSGDPTLDSAIAEFMSQHRGELGDIQDYRHPQVAWGQCEQVAEECSRFLRSKGFKADVGDGDLDDLGYHDAKPSESVMTPEGPAGEFTYPEHAVVCVYNERGIVWWTIDFTAAQYGYNEFPKVEPGPPGPLIGPQRQSTSAVVGAPTDPNADWESGIDPLPDNAYLWQRANGVDPLDIHSVTENLRGLEPGLTRMHPQMAKQAVVNALRSSLLGSRNNPMGHAVHYQTLMHIPADVDDPIAYRDALEQARERHNESQGYAPGSHKQYWPEEQQFKQWVKATNPELDDGDVQRLAQRELLHMLIEEEERILAQDQGEQLPAEMVEHQVYEALRKRLKALTKPKLDQKVDFGEHHLWHEASADDHEALRQEILNHSRMNSHLPTGTASYSINQWLAARGHSPQTLDQIHALNRQWDHGGGTEVQEAARKAILDHLHAGTDVGRALADQITMHTESARAWLDGQQERIQAIHDRRDEDLMDLDHERIWRATGRWPGDDAGEAGAPVGGPMLDHIYDRRREGIENNHQHALDVGTGPEAGMLYRQGEPQTVSAWTTDPEGANTSPLTTNNRIEPDRAMHLSEALRNYNILGAWGAPGENEVTLIHRGAMPHEAARVDRTLDSGEFPHKGKTATYHADMYPPYLVSRIRPMAQISRHADELAEAAREDLLSNKGRGHHFRAKALSLGIPQLGPRQLSHAWLHLAPQTSQLAPIDPLLMDALGHNYETDMSNRDYFKHERELAAGRDASGYGHAPLGAFSAGLWDLYAGGPGWHPDRTPFKAHGPTAHHTVDWSASVPSPGTWDNQYWWNSTQQARNEVAQDFDRSVAVNHPRDEVPFQKTAAMVCPQCGENQLNLIYDETKNWVPRFQCGHCGYEHLIQGETRAIGTPYTQDEINRMWGDVVKSPNRDPMFLDPSNWSDFGPRHEGRCSASLPSIQYHDEIDPTTLSGNAQGYWGRWPTTYDPRTGIVHVGPEGSMHSQLFTEGSGLEHGWIGHNPESDSGLDPTERQIGSTNIGWYNGSPGSHIDYALATRTWPRHPNSDAEDEGGYGHGYRLTSSSNRSPWVTHPMTRERLTGAPGTSLMQHLKDSFGHQTAQEVWGQDYEVGKGEPGKLGRVGADTTARRLRTVKRFERLYGPDRSKVVHEFPDGWTVRHLQTYADAEREGRLMGNCFSSHNDTPHQIWLDHPSTQVNVPDAVPGMRYRDDLYTWPESPEDLSLPLPEDGLYSLRSPENLPHVSLDFSEQNRDHAALGRHNSTPHVKYQPYLQQWADGSDNRAVQDWGQRLADPEDGGQTFEGHAGSAGTIAKVAMPRVKQWQTMYHIASPEYAEQTEQSGIPAPAYLWADPELAREYAEERLPNGYVMFEVTPQAPLRPDQEFGSFDGGTMAWISDTAIAPTQIRFIGAYGDLDDNEDGDLDDDEGIFAKVAADDYIEGFSGADNWGGPGENYQNQGLAGGKPIYVEVNYRNAFTGQGGVYKGPVIKINGPYEKNGRELYDLVINPMTVISVRKEDFTVIPTEDLNEAPEVPPDQPEHFAKVAAPPRFMYHGTSMEKAQRVQTSGLDPKFAEGGENMAKLIWLTTSYDDALDFGPALFRVNVEGLALEPTAGDPSYWTYDQPIPRERLSYIGSDQAYSVELADEDLYP